MSHDRGLRRRAAARGPVLPGPRVGPRPPERHLLAALRAAHAEAGARRLLLLRAEAALSGRALRSLAGWMIAEAEEQQRRIEHAFALLGERVTPEGAPARPEPPPELPALPRGALLDGALRALLLREARRGATEATALRLMAQAAGLHLVARLLDLTAEELRRAALELALPTGREARRLLH